MPPWPAYVSDGDAEARVDGVGSTLRARPRRWLAAERVLGAVILLPACWACFPEMATPAGAPLIGREMVKPDTGGATILGHVPGFRQTRGAGD